MMHGRGQRLPSLRAADLGIRFESSAGDSGTVKLEQVAAAFLVAQREESRERVPLQGAMTTGDQDIARRPLGERPSDVATA
jgi:hypothetical protein